MSIARLPFAGTLALLAVALPLAASPASPSTASGEHRGAPDTVSPLRRYLAAKRAAIGTLSRQAVEPLTIHAVVTAESRSGVRRLRIGDFQTLSDSEREAAGFNLGPGSWDSLVGALASSVADEYLVQAALKEVPLDSLDVEFTSSPEDPAVAQTRKVRYPRNLAYIAYVTSPATDAQLEDLRQAVEKHSAALALVTQPQALEHLQVTHVRTSEARDPGQPPGLRDFIKDEQRPANLRAEGKPAAAAVLRAVTHVEPHTGLRDTRTGVHHYQQLHDSLPGLLGHGITLTSEEHLIGITGTCLTHIFEIQAGTRNVPLDSLQLTVDATLTPRFGKGITAPSRYQDIRYTVRIESPASDADIDGLREAVEASCPLYNLLKDEQPVHGQVVHHAYHPES